MAPKTDTGGPAFPEVEYFDEKPIGTESGMTLRDYFAKGAMEAELNTAGANLGAAEALITAANLSGQTIVERIAFNSYRMADAMLVERRRRNA